GACQYRSGRGSDRGGLGLSPSLDRDGAFSWGRQAALGGGGWSGAQRRGADPPRLSRQHSVQSPDALVAAEPCAGVGSADADNHRRSLSSRQSRDAGARRRLDCREAHGRALVHPRDKGCVGPVLTLQKLSDDIAEKSLRLAPEVVEKGQQEQKERAEVIKTLGGGVADWWQPPR